MNVFLTCLRKEWMEQRSWAATLAISVPVLAIAYCIGFPEQWHKFSNITLLCGTLSMMLAGLSLGGRLVGSEVSSAGMRFLDRLPNGLPVSFLVKATLLVLALVVCTLHGNVVACVIRSLAFGEHGHWHMVFSMKQWAPLLAFLGPSFGLMAMSAWMPRSGMTLPGLVLLYLVTLGPAWLCFDLMPGLKPALREVLIAWFVISAGLVMAAGTSFIRGYRRSGGPARSLLNGGLVLLLFTLPVWGWTGYRAWRWVHCDPTEADVNIFDAFVGADRRYAWVNAVHMEPDRRGATGPSHTFRIDLQTGAWKRDGGPGTWYDTVGALDMSSRAESRTGFPNLIVRLTEGSPEREILDTETGAVVHRLGRGESTAPISDAVRAVKRSTAPFRLSDGRRVWFHEGNLEVETRNGSVEILVQADALACRFSPVTGGVPALSMPDGKTYLCDLDGRVLTNREIFDQPRVVAVLDSAYLVSYTRSRQWDKEWLLEDPETGVRRPALGLGPRDRVSARQDGRRIWVVTRREDREPGGWVFLLDPLTGQRKLVPCPLVGEGTVSGLHDAGHLAAPARTPDGRRVFKLWMGGGVGSHCLARFDEEKGLLSATVALRPAGDMHLLACPDNESAIVLRGRRVIERLHFGSYKREVLFPRP